MMRLPYEIMSLIGEQLRRMRECDAISELNLVSRAWCEATRSFIFEFVLFYLTPDERPNSDEDFTLERRMDTMVAHYLPFFTSHPHLAKMVRTVVVKSYPLSIEEVVQMKTVFTQLSRLYVEESDISPNVLHHLIYGFPHLNTLIINPSNSPKSGPMTQDMMISHVRMALSSLTYAGPPAIVTGVLQALAASPTCTSLKSLSCYLDDLPSDFGHFMKLCRMFENIESLTWRPDMEEEDAEKIRKLLAQKIDLSIGSMPHLKSLHMMAHRDVHFFDLISATLLHATVPSLCRLTMSVAILNDDDLEMLAGSSWSNKSIMSATTAAQIDSLEITFITQSTVDLIRPKIVQWMAPFGSHLRRECVRFYLRDIHPESVSSDEAPQEIKMDEWPSQQED